MKDSKDKHKPWPVNILENVAPNFAQPGFITALSLPISGVKQIQVVPD